MKSEDNQRGKCQWVEEGNSGLFFPWKSCFLGKHRNVLKLISPSILKTLGSMGLSSFDEVILWGQPQTCPPQLVRLC